MYWFYYIVGPILGGVIALSGLIAKKSPDAEKVLNQILPYKAFIGVGMLVLGVLGLLDALPHLGDYFKMNALLGITVIGVLASLMLLGAMLGIPQIVKWIPGDSAPEAKAAEIAKKLVMYETPLGILGIASGTLMLLFKVGIL